MNLDFLNLGGFGQFVWPAFIFTFVSCFVLYVKTRNELLKQEKIFSKEFTKTQSTEIETAKYRETLSASPIHQTN
jgi:heme exporter protein D